MTSKQRILITGSSGTVGTCLALALRDRGVSVRGLDLKGSLWDAKLDYRTARIDLRKPVDKRLIGRRPDMIIHLAANARVHDSVVSPQLAFDNYLMTHNVLEYARKEGIRKLMFASSREIYGDSTEGKKRKETSTSVDWMKSPYTASKFGSEALIGAYSECYDLSTVIVRLSNVYGKYDVSERVVPLFLYYALRNKQIEVFGPDKKLDFTYIDDCVDALCRIVDRFKKVDGQTFNISRGKGEKLLDLAETIVRLTDSQSEIRIGKKRVGEISSFVGDISLAKDLLGYAPKVSLKEGLSLGFEWYQQAMQSRRVYESQRRNLSRRGWA